MQISDVSVQKGILTFIWAFDLGAFIGENDEAFRLARSNRGWLEQLEVALNDEPPSDRLNAADARIDRSQFEAANERVGASTLAAQQSRQQMPLRIPGRHSGWAEGGLGFRWRLQSASVSPHGAGAVRYEADLIKPLHVEDVISSYHQLIQVLRADVNRVVKELLALLTRAGGPIDGVSFQLPMLTDTHLDSYLVGYESFDVELSLIKSDGQQVAGPIKSYIQEDELECVRQLAALSRMTRTEPDHYSWERLRAFQRADIGNREDELWIVNSHRMLRFHPERSAQRIQWFYDDVLCLTELAVQQLAILEYTDHWLGEARASLRRRMSMSDIGIESVQATGEVLRSIEAITDVIVQPHSLTIGIRHPFFRTVADRLIDELGLRTTGEQILNSTDLFLNVSAAVFSHEVSVSSQMLDRDNMGINRSIHRLAAITAAAAILALAVSAVALWINGGEHTTTIIRSATPARESGR